MIRAVNFYPGPYVPMYDNDGNYVKSMKVGKGVPLEYKSNGDMTDKSKKYKEDMDNLLKKANGI